MSQSISLDGRKVLMACIVAAKDCELVEGFNDDDDDNGQNRLHSA